MEPSVQVAVPVDLNAHDSSLGRKQEIISKPRWTWVMQLSDISLHSDDH